MGQNPYTFGYDLASGKILKATAGIPDLWGTAIPTLTLDDSTIPTGGTVYNNHGNYLIQNGKAVLQPSLSCTVSQTTTPNGQYTITATLNNPPATPPASCTFTVAGQTSTAPIAAGKATLTVSVHPSIVNQSISITASATGCVSGTVNIGGSKTDIGLQAFTPTGSTISTIAPIGTGSKGFLQSYYALSPATLYALLADIGTVVSILTDTMFNIVIPALQKTTWAPIALDANQTNTFSDIKTNVLPNLYTTLENAYPSGGTKQLQFSDYEADLSKSYKAFQNYMSDLQVIPNLA